MVRYRMMVPIPATESAQCVVLEEVPPQIPYRGDHEGSAENEHCTDPHSRDDERPDPRTTRIAPNYGLNNLWLGKVSRNASTCDHSESWIAFGRRYRKTIFHVIL